MTAMTTTDQRRFLSKFLVGDGCFVWQGGAMTKKTNGYGQFWLNGRMVVAHRVAYELFVGPIPDGLQLDHLCRNRACVRPDHLEPVTNRENTLRGYNFIARNATRTHCPQGHPYDEENTLVYDDRRYCRTCQRDRKRRLRAKEAA